MKFETILDLQKTCKDSVPLDTSDLVFSSVQSLSCVQLFVTPLTEARQGSLSITNSRSLLKLMFTELVMPSNHLILNTPLSSCLQSFPVSGSIPMSQFVKSSGQIIGASASIITMNVKNWFPLGWSGWISLKSKALSRVFSSTTIQSINSSVLRLLEGLILTSTHDHGKNHSSGF